MKKKLNILLLLLLATSLIGYTEWGKNQSAFIFQMEYELFFGSKGNLNNLAHPLIFLPLTGQLILIYSLATKRLQKKVIITGASAIFFLLFVFFSVGILTQNSKIIASSLPYLTVYCYLLYFFKKAN